MKLGETKQPLACSAEYLLYGLGKYYKRGGNSYRMHYWSQLSSLQKNFCVFLPKQRPISTHLHKIRNIDVAKVFDWGGLNHQSHAMTPSEIFERETFYGIKIS